MPRSRVIKPEFWNDEKLAKVSRDARLTFIGVWTCSDDFGVTKGNEAWLKSQIYPYEDGIKLSKFEEWLGELEELKVIIPFKFHEEKFYYIKNFSKHQKVDHPSKNRNPEPPEDIESDSYSYLSNILAKDSREFRDETEYKQNINRNSIVQGFDEFWKAYPKKVGKQEAKKAWERQNGNRPTLEVIISKIESLKHTEQWTKQNGQFIPNPSTWLNRGGWDDECLVELIRNSEVKYLDPKEDAEKYGWK
jgi:hypothetical protein